MRTALILLCFCSLLSCKKLVEDKQRDILVDAITNGTWYVQKYVEGTVDITVQFVGYEFDFDENGTVTAYHGPLTTPGTWTGDINNYSITAAFPGSGDPLKKLTGIWKLTDSYTNYVEAEQNTSTGKNILFLRKKE
jgi:hypothetical protein